MLKKKTKQKVKISSVSGIRVYSYKLLSKAVEDGISWGWMRAHKHTDTPSADETKASIEKHVLSEICEYFDFDTGVC